MSYFPCFSDCFLYIPLLLNKQKNCSFLEKIFSIRIISIAKFIDILEKIYVFKKYKYLYLLVSKFNESRYIALFVVSGSIKKLSLIDYGSIYPFQYFIQYFSPVEKFEVTPKLLTS